MHPHPVLSYTAGSFWGLHHPSTNAPVHCSSSTEEAICCLITLKDDKGFLSLFGQLHAVCGLTMTCFIANLTGPYQFNFTPALLVAHLQCLLESEQEVTRQAEHKVSSHNRP